MEENKKTDPNTSRNEFTPVLLNIFKNQNRFLDFYAAHHNTSKSETVRILISQLIEQNQGIWNYTKKVLESKDHGDALNEYDGGIKCQQ